MQAPHDHRRQGPADGIGARSQANSASPEQSPSGVEFTCPMHPEIVRDGPGSCPICGMALEPRAVTTEEAPNTELIDMRRRFFATIGPAAIVFAMGMSDLLPGMPLHHVIG